MERRLRFFIVLTSLFLITTSFLSLDWGFFAHRRINRMAVFTLPPEMIVFYKKHIDYITEQAIAPDMRRYASPHEAPRHYINADVFDEYPFEKVPRRWTNAMAKFTDVYAITMNNDTIHLFGEAVTNLEQHIMTLYNSNQLPNFSDTISLNIYQYYEFVQRNILSQYYQKNWKIEGDSLSNLFLENGLEFSFKGGFAKDRLSEHGILPWHLLRTYYNLVKAFKTNDAKRILRISAEFGHYVGDAHVPLHTTQNYNGQLTDQVGIHAFWETRIPELFADDSYSYFVGKADYIENKRDFFWNTILESYSLVDSVLLIEKELSKHLDQDQQYCFEQRGERTIRTECTDYATIYHDRMDGMVEQQFQKAIHALGSCWYSAWIDAGQPNLKVLLSGEKIEDEEEEKKLKKAFEEGKINGRKH